MTTYRGGADTRYRYVDVDDADDRAFLLHTGSWQQVEAQDDDATQDEPSTHLSTAEAADTLGLDSAEAVRDLIERGDLEATKDGNRYQVSVESIAAYQAQQANGQGTTQQIADAENGDTQDEA